MKNDRALSGAELELTQRFQLHFPARHFPPEQLAKWNSCPKELITNALEEVVSREPSSFQPPLLVHETSINISGQKRFIASRHFRKDNEDGVEIAFMSDSFKRLFLDRMEENIGDTVLNFSKLARPSKDDAIREKLRGKEETFLYHLWRLLKNQPKGDEDGPMLTNGYANIFYIRGTEVDPATGDNVWAVRAYRLSDGWCLDACSVLYPGGWGAGRRVVAR